MTGPAFIVLGGLPGTGKSIIARALARATGAAWLRIDTINREMRAVLGAETDLRDWSYRIAAAQARDILACEQSVIADSVNPMPETRAIYRAASVDTGARLAEVEITCSDAAEHRRRIEYRYSAAAGATGLPDWNSVAARRFDPWPGAALTLDTALLSPTDAVEKIRAHLAAD